MSSASVPARQRSITRRSSGVSGGSYMMPILMNEELGTKFRPILGFESNAKRAMSMQQGEITGQCGTYLSSIKAGQMGAIVIEAATNATLKANGRIELKAKTGVTIDGGAGPVEINGSLIKLG